MGLITELAWRNLWRNRRRTAIILLAILLGLWAMLMTVAFMRGASQQIFNDAINNLTGHIQIHAPAYLDDPIIEHTLSWPDPDILTILNDPAVAQWSVRLRVPAIISSEQESAGVVLVGIDPQQEQGLSFITDVITDGRMLSDLNDQGIIIGKKLAERLETTLDRRVVIMSQDKQNNIADRGIRIVGVFDADLEATETQYIFVSRDVASRLLNVPGQVSEISIKLHDIEQLDHYVQLLRHQFPKLDVQPWQELQPLLSVQIELYDSSGLIWDVIVFLAMGFGLVNTLLMSVFERMREFGMFQALGMRPRHIVAQVWCEALFLLLLGLLLGNLVSWFSVWLSGDGIDVSGFAAGAEMANLHNIIPFVLTLGDMLTANLVIIVLGMLASLYPAWRAARLAPADALTRI